MDQDGDDDAAGNGAGSGNEADKTQRTGVLRTRSFGSRRAGSYFLDNTSRSTRDQPKRLTLGEYLTYKLNQLVFVAYG